MPLPGVYIAKKKDGTIYYRSSITYKNKHISLGSFLTELLAHEAYRLASSILVECSYSLSEYTAAMPLTFDKWVILMNVRDNGLYIKTPIYLKENHFIYYLGEDDHLIFDIDDLFFYAHHKILRRGGYLFVSDYGMQINILSRYGIHNFSVKDRDYRFRNQDDSDYRYSNIEVINPYYGVTKSLTKKGFIFTAKIHVNGDYIIGRFKSEVEAAVAYNKAADYLKQKGIKKNYAENYISELDEIGYAALYNKIRISKKIRETFP